MKIYGVRWRDGSFSVTLAKNKLHALEEFDKIADANGLKIEEFDEFLATFKLTESGDIVLEEIDSDTRGELGRVARNRKRPSQCSKKRIGARR
ncbi:MAG TPA: hypothetical protein VE170_03605 [Candidatus Limnocylindria bacterium]|nr:hypothetical protein [Candidatus Limnocylindria bacterium]